MTYAATPPTAVDRTLVDHTPLVYTTFYRVAYQAALRLDRGDILENPARVGDTSWGVFSPPTLESYVVRRGRAAYRI
jgi:hypothetical protein